MMTLPHRLLIANRGEIAVRIMKTCQVLGIETVWPRCPEDEKSLASHNADIIVDLQAPGDYLQADKLVELALQTQSEAVHPGYGYLSENKNFARQVREAGLVFIGPEQKALEVMGDKLTSRQAMIQAGVPVVPGTDNIVNAQSALEEIGLPVLLKPSGGGGGKGMIVVERAEDLESSLDSCRRQAQKAFADDRVYMEKWIPRARHIEVQIMADSQGQVRAYGTRDCSVQRRHQKIVEECPAPGLPQELLSRLEQAAIQAAQAVNYLGAGTVEFILTPDHQFYFLEMNTRLQVEHPVTELVWGVDLVAEQIQVAMGHPLSSAPQAQGHAIEVRVYAEDPSQNFLPCIGRVGQLILPQGPSIRVDSGILTGSEVGIHFDPMILKICAWGLDREEACRRLIAALKDFVLHGVGHNGRFLLDVLSHDIFQSEQMYTRWLEEEAFDHSLPFDPAFALVLAYGQNQGGGARSTLASESLPSAFLQSRCFEFQGDSQ